MEKTNLKVIEKTDEFNLSFNLPIASISDTELAALYGGNTNLECPCRRGGTLVCDCFNGVLKKD